MNEAQSKPPLRTKGRLMSASEIERTLVRLAHEIVEKSNASQDLALIGIKRRGVPLAERLGKLISGIEKRPIDTGVLDIQFYRDDLSTAGVRPVVTAGAIGFDIGGRDVVLCDDVLYTGRTIKAARAAYNWPCSSTAATASCPSRPRTSAGACPPAAARSSKSSSARSTTTSRYCWSSASIKRRKVAAGV
jgi:hypoxanthine-guanine phosphoribosyltransferase